MIKYNDQDPIFDNPLRKLGISGRALVGKTPEEAYQLASAIAAPLRKSEKIPADLRSQVEMCLKELRHPEKLKAAFHALKGLTPSEEASRLAEVANKLQRRADLEERAAWLYQLEQGATPSLHNGVRMVPALIQVTDVISFLSTPISESHPLARKLFGRSIKSIGDGQISGGATLPVPGESRREMLGVLHLSTNGRPFELRDIERVLVDLGIVNAPSSCIEHYQLTGTDEPATKVLYPRPNHSVYSHFHPLEVLERLLLVDLGDIQGSIRAQIPKVDSSSCNVLLSRVLFGPCATLCIEGVLESVAPLDSHSNASLKQLSGETTGPTAPRSKKAHATPKWEKSSPSDKKSSRPAKRTKRAHAE